MKQLLPFILFIFLSFEIIAQDVVIDPDPYIETFAIDFSTFNAEGLTHSTITNNTQDTMSIKWELLLTDPNCSSEWQYQICDNNNCYVFGVLSNEGGPINKLVFLEPGEHSILDVHIKPNGVEGCCVPVLQVSNYFDPSTVYANSNYEICMENATAVTEREKANLRVFPNPTSSYFSLSTNNFVKEVWVSNILGKRVKSYVANASNNYDVSALPDGIYLVSMVDEDENVLKTVRISKRSIRP